MTLNPDERQRIQSLERKVNRLMRESLGKPVPARSSPNIELTVVETHTESAYPTIGRKMPIIFSDGTFDEQAGDTEPPVYTRLSADEQRRAMSLSSAFGQGDHLLGFRRNRRWWIFEPNKEAFVRITSEDRDEAGFYPAELLQWHPGGGFVVVGPCKVKDVNE